VFQDCSTALFPRTLFLSDFFLLESGWIGEGLRSREESSHVNSSFPTSGELSL